ncbi:hypothetical protein LOK49_Contig193G00002 [Camellia lanceoleosa]|nr:hypothetical protein LOK49_Contig193G00002 [Camellia lanceoleosa]
MLLLKRGKMVNIFITKDTAVLPNSPDTVDSDEIVQIPWDENEVGDPGLQLTHDDQMIHVPITDAPLIGAPFPLTVQTSCNKTTNRKLN